MRVKCITLGCKLNYYESCGLSEALEVQGFTPVAAGPAEVILVNSCAVTSRAGMQSRQRVRREIRENPGSLVLLVGCYAQFDPAGSAAIAGLGAVVGNAGKAEIPAWVAAHAGQVPAIPAVFGLEGSLPVAALRVSGFPGRSRALLKIQDGCNAFCSYCIIPFLRRRSRSLPPAAVLAEAENLAAAGYGELGLTGVHLGQYGLDLQPPTRLASLLEELERLPRVRRLRLGSLQPPEIDRELAALVTAADSKVCEHLHLSLQSLANGVLQAMGRRYTREQINRLATEIKRCNPRVTLGADLIVGFPAESRADFQAVCRALAELPLDYLHVFPYSPRPGTRAAAWPPAAPEKEIKERVAVVREIGAAMKRRCYEANVGREHEVVLEKKLAAPAGAAAWSGHTRNYLQVRVTFAAGAGSSLRPGACCRVMAVGHESEPDDVLLAEK